MIQVTFRGGSRENETVMMQEPLPASMEGPPGQIYDLSEEPEPEGTGTRTAIYQVRRGTERPPEEPATLL